MRPQKKPDVVEDKYYTHEDIQNDKRSQFDKELNIKKNEFTSAVTLKIPPVPKFSDIKDEPIVEMDEALRKMAEQRKYDIDQIPLFMGVPKGQAHPSVGRSPPRKPPTADLDQPLSFEKREQNFGSTQPLEKVGPNLPHRAAEGGELLSPRGGFPKVDVEQKSIRGVPSGGGFPKGPVYIKIDKENIVDNINEVIDLEPKRQITWSQTNDIIEKNIVSKLKHLKPETSNSFQQELDELKIKVELMNVNINKILELLTRKQPPF